jgi:hypothetical protein
MKSLSILYTILTIAISFTMNVWDGTAFALAPLLATIGGVILRVASERGDTIVGSIIAAPLLAGAWVLVEWLGLRVDVLSLDFAAGWWMLPGFAVGFLAAEEFLPD